MSTNPAASNVPNTTDGLSIQTARNKRFLARAPEYALDQIKDAKTGANDTRTNAVRVNASLPPETWESVDSSTYMAEKDTLVITQDLLDAGLEHDQDLMQSIDTWNVMDDAGAAKTTFTGPEARAPEISVSYDQDGCPVPIHYVRYSTGFREGDVDSALSTLASRLVNERVERSIIGDVPNDMQATPPSQPTTSNMYGLTDHPDTNTNTTSEDWVGGDTAVYGDMKDMRSVLKNENNFSPGRTGFWVYMGTEFYDVLDEYDPNATGTATKLRDSVEGLAGIGQIKELDFLPPKSVLMFKPSPEVIEVGNANDLQTVQWEDPFRDQFCTMSARYPRTKTLRRRNEPRSGIAYWVAP